MCTIDRSLSRRVKVWLRSTIVEISLNGLAKITVLRRIIVKCIKHFNDKVFEKFLKKSSDIMFKLNCNSYFTTPCCSPSQLASNYTR